ncbi:helix-turn-helix domain-containing protein [Luedemannella flava]
MTSPQQWTGIHTRALREAHLMSVRDFANLLNVSASSVSAWEADAGMARLRPSTATAGRCAGVGRPRSTEAIRNSDGAGSRR